jgi:hypothetical protein
VLDRTTSSGWKTTRLGCRSASIASASRMSTALEPRSSLGCRIDDSGTTAAPAMAMSS